MYDTSNPYEWKYYKTVLYHGGQWTITDATLSPDNRYLAYSSIRSIVSLAQTDPGESGDPWLLDFSDIAGGGRRDHGSSHFGVCLLELQYFEPKKLKNHRYGPSAFRETAEK